MQDWKVTFFERSGKESHWTIVCENTLPDAIDASMDFYAEVLDRDPGICGFKVERV